MSFEPRLPDESVNVSEGSPLREAMLLVAGVVAVTVVLTFAIAVSIEWIVPRIPIEYEKQLFGRLGVAVGEAQGDAQNPDAIAVQALVDRLAAHWEDAPYEFRSFVSDDEMVNAFAVPGGIVFVTRGLLERVESENELAFILGHELGHFRGRDHLSGLGRGFAIGILSFAIGLGNDTAAFLANSASSLSSRHFDRDQESDADLFGLELLVREYGHGAGAQEVFERVLRSEDEIAAGDKGRIGRAAERMGNYFATHPIGPKRIEALHEYAAAREWPLVGESAPWALPSAELAAEPPES